MNTATGLSPAARHRLVQRLDVAECNCPTDWFDVPFADGTSIRWLRPCPHVLAALAEDSPQHHDLLVPDWIVMMTSDDPDGFRYHPPPRQQATTKTERSRVRVMMLREEAGEDLFHSDDVTDLPRILSMPKMHGNFAPDTEQHRPAKRLVTALRGAKLAALVPPGLLAAAAALAALTDSARLIVLSEQGRLYSVEAALATPAQYAAAVLAIEPEGKR